MIFDEVHGLPKPNGAGDWNDSSHLAGLLKVLDHPQQVDCRKYADLNNGEYYRHPAETQYNFSRDQAIILMCGYIAQGHNEYVNLSFITGKDILPPSVRGIEAIAKTGKASRLSHLWLKTEIAWHGKFQPLDEPFQIVAMAITYKEDYLKSWVKANPMWRWSIYFYFGGFDTERFRKELRETTEIGFFQKLNHLRYLLKQGGNWRNEPELSEWIIKKIEGMTA